MEPEQDQRPIEQQFAESWEGMERYFTNLTSKPNWAWMKSIVALISELRSRGYDQQFRAGQSMWQFIISRSKKHGLRRGQARLFIVLDPDGGMIVTYLESPNPPVEAKLDRVELTPELEQLLQRLLTHPIT